MAIQVWRNAFVWIGGTDYSNNFSDVALNYSAEMLDATRMGDDTRRKKGGLFNWSMVFKAHQDFAAGNLGANIFALVGTTTCVEIRPLNSCTTVINPSYSGIGVISQAPQVTGAVGALLDVPLTIENFGTLSRASSS